MARAQVVVLIYVALTDFQETSIGTKDRHALRDSLARQGVENHVDSFSTCQFKTSVANERVRESIT